MEVDSPIQSMSLYHTQIAAYSNTFNCDTDHKFLLLISTSYYAPLTGQHENYYWAITQTSEIVSSKHLSLKFDHSLYQSPQHRCQFLYKCFICLTIPFLIICSHHLQQCLSVNTTIHFTRAIYMEYPPYFLSFNFSLR